MRVGGLHCVGVFGTDAEGLKDTVEVVFVRHPLTAASVLLREGRRDLTAVPGTRLEKGLVIIARERCRLVRLNERTLAAAFTAGADFQNERYIVAAGSHPFAQGLNLSVFFELDTPVHRMVLDRHGFLQYTRRMVSFGTKSAGYVFGHIHTVAALIVQHHTVTAGRHSAVHTEGGGLIVRQLCVVPVEADACRSRAIRRISGSCLPRAEALRRIPRHAV